MNLKQSLIKNTAYVGISRVISNVLAYLVVLIISQNLGPEGLGKYSFVLAFASLFFLVSNFGTTTYLTTEGARNPKKISELMSSILSLRIVSLVFFLIIYFFVSVFFVRDVSLLLLMFAALYESFVNMYSIPRAILTIKHKGLKISLVDFIQQLLLLIFALIAILGLSNLTMFLFFMVIVSFSRFFTMYLFAKKYVKFRFVFKLEKYKNILKYSYPFLLVVLFSTINSRFDTILLGFMKSEAVVGWYNAGYKIINFIVMIPSVFMMFSIPSFSSLFEKNKLVAKKLLEKLVYYSNSLLIPIVVGGLLVGGRIIDFLYGFNSVETVISFKILIVSSAFIFLSAILGTFLSAIKKQKVFALIGGLGALANIILNIIFIPEYSLYGAGVVTGFTYLVMMFFMIYYIRKYVMKINLLNKIYIPLISAILMSVVIFLLRSQHLLIIIPIATIVYLLPVFLYEIKTDKDLLNIFKKS